MPLPAGFAHQSKIRPGNKIPFPGAKGQRPDVYRLASVPEFRDQPRYRVLDNIVTTGSTMKAIIDALRWAHPGSPRAILQFSLAKADYNASFNLFHRLAGRNDSLEQGARWMLGEPA